VTAVGGRPKPEICFLLGDCGEVNALAQGALRRTHAVVMCRTPNIPFERRCCDRKFRAQSFAPWQQATIEIMLAISLTIACSRYMYYGVILHAHTVRGESHNQRNTTGEVASEDTLPLSITTHRCVLLPNTCCCYFQNAMGAELDKIKTLSEEVQLENVRI